MNPLPLQSPGRLSKCSGTGAGGSAGLPWILRVSCRDMITCLYAHTLISLLESLLPYWARMWPKMKASFVIWSRSSRLPPTLGTYLRGRQGVGWRRAGGSTVLHTRVTDRLPGAIVRIVGTIGRVCITSGPSVSGRAVAVLSLKGVRDHRSTCYCRPAPWMLVVDGILDLAVYRIFWIVGIDPPEYGHQGLFLLLPEHPVDIVHKAVSL